MNTKINDAVEAVPMPTLNAAQALPPFSLGICSHDPNRAQEASFHWHRALKDVAPQAIPVMVVNAKSMASGYNQIIANCPTELLILSHHDAHPFPIPSYFVGKRLLERMKNIDVLGFAGASEFNSAKWFSAPGTAFGSVINFPAVAPGQLVAPEIQQIWALGMRPCGVTCWNRPARLVKGIKVMDGYCMVVRTSAAKKLLFDEKLTHFHLYDLDFSLRAFYENYRTAICCDLHISHSSAGSYVQPEWVEAAKYFLDKWKGKADPTLIETGPGYGAWQSQDARLVLAQLQRFEKFMVEEIDAQELRYSV